jgi:hypothetical protein
VLYIYVRIKKGKPWFPIEPHPSGKGTFVSPKSPLIRMPIKDGVEGETLVSPCYMSCKLMVFRVVFRVVFIVSVSVSAENRAS